MSKNFTIMNVVSVYSEQELIKRFPKLSDPKVMKSFLSSSLIDESDDTKFIKTSSGMLDDNKYRLFDEDWITELYDYDEREIEYCIDIIDQITKSEDNQNKTKEWTEE